MESATVLTVDLTFMSCLCFRSFSFVRSSSLDASVEWEIDISAMHVEVHEVAVHKDQWSSEVPSNCNWF